MTNPTTHAFVTWTDHPRPRWVIWFEKWHDVAVAILVSLVVLWSGWPVARWQTLVALGLYAASVALRRWLAGQSWSSAAYRHPYAQFARSFVTSLGTFIFFLILLAERSYLSNFYQRDTLWLLMVLSLMIASLHTSTTLSFLAAAWATFLVILTQVWAGYLQFLSISPGGNLFNYLQSGGILQGLGLVFPKVLWLFILATILHMSIRFISRRQASLELLRRVTEDMTVASTTDTHGREFMQRAVDEIARTFRYDHVNIFLKEADKSLRIVAAASEQGQKLIQKNFRLSAETQSMNNATAQGGEARCFNDVHAPETQGIYYTQPEFDRTQAELVVALKVGQDVIGTLDIQHEQRDIFSEHDVAVMQTLANALAIAYTNAQNLGFGTKMMNELQAISRLSQDVSSRLESHLDLPNLLRAIAMCARDVLTPVDIVVVYEVDPDGEISPPYWAGDIFERDRMVAPPAVNSTVHRVLDYRDDLFVSDVNAPEARDLLGQDFPRPGGRSSFIVREKIASMAAIQLWATRPERIGSDDVQVEQIGIMFLNYRKSQMFDDQFQRQTILMFASLAALAIQKVQVYRLVGAQEKTVYARDLHDIYASRLHGILLMLDALQKSNALADRDRRRIQEIAQVTEHLYKDTRFSEKSLEDTSLQGGLGAAVSNLVESFNLVYQGTPAVSVEVDGTEKLASGYLTWHAYAIVNEALHNALFHSRATQIAIRLEFRARQLEITVTDNGRGFDQNSISPRGLRNIVARAQHLKGDQSIHSELWHGTAVKVVMPWDPSSPETTIPPTGSTDE